jgi:hypothetical protein
MSIEVNKTDRIVNVTVEKKYGTNGTDGKSIEADIDIAGQRVGFKQEGEANFQYIDLPKLEFDDLTQEEKDSLKLTFDQLTQAEKDSLKGEQGEQGIQGIQGDPGSDANVTQANIESALPYTIANNSIKNTPYVYPSWFGGLKISANIHNGKGITSFDPEILIEDKLLTYPPYYISPNGSDSNDGLSPNTPKSNIQNAITSGAKLIYLLPGIYNRNINTDSITVTDDLFLIGIGEVQISTAQAGLSWSLNSGSTYSTSRSGVESVIDTEEYQDDGRYFLNTRVYDLTTCQNTPGTWFQSGSTLYVHRKNGNQPNDNVLANVSVSQRIYSESGFICLKNLEFLNHEIYIESTSVSTTATGIVKNCKKVYPREDYNGNGKNGITINSLKKCYIYNCIIGNQVLDCINFHDTLGVGGEYIEVNNTAYNPGINNGGSNQCSTFHDGVKGVRIGCNYYGGNPQVIADVDVGTETILIGCEVNSENATVAIRATDADIFGCNIYGEGTIDELNSSNGGVTVKNSITEIGGTSGSVTIT